MNPRLKMSLCLRAVKLLGDPDIAMLTDAIEGRVKQGIDIEQAQHGALDEMLAGVGSERDEIMALLREQRADLFDDRGEVKATVPAVVQPKVDRTVKNAEQRKQALTKRGETPVTLREKFKGLSARDRQIVLDVLGMDEQGNQVGQPMSYAQLGEKYLSERGATKGQPMTRAAIQKILKQVGINKEVIDRVVAESAVAEPVSAAELEVEGIEGEAKGYRVTESPSKGDDFELDPRTVRDQKATDKALEEAGVSTKKADLSEPLTDAQRQKKADADAVFEQKRRDVAALNKLRAEQKEKADAKDPLAGFEEADIEFAKSEWNLGSVDTDPLWDELPDWIQARYVKAASAFGADQMSGKLFERIHGEIANEVRDRRLSQQPVDRDAELVQRGGPEETGEGVSSGSPRLANRADPAQRGAVERRAGQGESRHSGSASNRVGGIRGVLAEALKSPFDFVTKKPSRPLKWAASAELDFGTLKNPTNAERWAITAASETLLATPFADFFNRALDQVRGGIGALVGRTPNIAGVFGVSPELPPVIGLARNQNASGLGVIRVRGDSRTKDRMQLTRVLAHELTHAMDFAAAEAAGAPMPMPVAVNSNATTHVGMSVNPDTRMLVLNAGPVAAEVIKFASQFSGDIREISKSDPDPDVRERAALFVEYLAYPYGQLFTWMNLLYTEADRASALKTHAEAIEAAIGLAQAEAPTMLTEMFLVDNELMKQHLPHAWRAVEKALTATDLEGYAYAYGLRPNGASIYGKVPTTKHSIGPVAPHYRDNGLPGPLRSPAKADPWAGAARVSGRSGERGANGRSVFSRNNAGDGRARLSDIPPPPNAAGGLKGWLDSIADTWRNAPSSLGWLSTEQLADRFKEMAPVKTFHRAMMKMSATANQIMVASDKLKRHWETVNSRHGEKKALEFYNFLLDVTRSQVWPNVALAHPSNAHVAVTNREQIAAYQRLKAEWAKLPEDYKRLFTDLQKDFNDKFEQKVTALRNSIVQSHYPPPGATGAPTEGQVNAAAKLKKSDRKAFLKANGTSKLKADTLKALWRELDEHAREFPTKLAGPYFPLMRFGDHIISVKSAGYLAAEKDVADATAAMEAEYNKEGYDPDDESPVLKAARKKVTDAKAAIGKLKANDNDYLVEFYESLHEARARRAQLEQHFKGTDVKVKQSLRNQYVKELDAVTPTFMKRLEDRISDGLPETEAALVRRSMREIYLQMLPDRSALKSQMRRMSVAGVKAGESIRAYSASAVRDAWHISRLANQEPVRSAMNELRFSDDLDSKMVGNELAQRVAQNFKFEEHKWMSAATNATYLTYLGLSPAFTAVQLTQPWVISLPVIAARHGGRTLGALGRAWKQAAQLVKVSYDKEKSLGFTADPEAAAAAGVITTGEAKMLRQMLDSGRIDITITHDLGASAEGRSAGWLGKATAMSAWPAHQAEILNRVSTALAAYRLEKAKSGDEKAAAEYADRIVAETHLNYAPENRARFMHANAWGGWGRIMFQFRTYQQGMLYLIFKNLYDGVRGDREAMRAVAYLAGMQLGAAGLTGLPITAPALFAATVLYKMFTEDDEEQDLKEMMFQGLKSSMGETAARAIIKGIPAALGADLSQRVGLGNIMSPAPYVDDRSEGRDLAAAYWFAVTGGAPGGMIANWAEAVHLAQKGDYSKAVLMALPKVLADVGRGASYGVNGLTDSNGNPIVKPDEMSAAEVAAKMLGFQPTDVARTQESRRAFFKAREAKNEVRNRLMAELVQARLQNKPNKDAEADRIAYNERHPTDKITPSDVIKATARRRQQERSMQSTGGIPVRKSDRDVAQRLFGP